MFELPFFVAIALVRALSLIVLIDVLMSWVSPNPNSGPAAITRRFTQPLYELIHEFLDPMQTGGFDMAPLLWLVGLGVLSHLLWMGLASL